MKKSGKPSVFLTTVCLIFLCVISPLSARDLAEVRLALIGFENMENDNQHDYLSSLISAVLTDDLSNTDGIVLLERDRMDAILSEQKLQISGLFDEGSAAEAGKLLSSDYLAGGNFLVIGTEVLVDITLIDIETGRVTSFSGRGNSEDTIHLAAEKIARLLTGNPHIFRSADSDKPIIKDSLLPPGSLKLFSPLSGARIYIDDEFYGYTTGNSRVPVEIELKPGPHRVQTDLGREFGVVIEPEILFRKWEKEFEIESGKSVTLEDPTRHFNDTLYRIHKILGDSRSFNNGSSTACNIQTDFSFQDREGFPISGNLTIVFTPADDGGLKAQVMLKYDYDRKVWDIECEPDKTLEFEQTIGFVDLRIDIDSTYTNRTSASWSLWRNDVNQGMFSE